MKKDKIENLLEFAEYYYIKNLSTGYILIEINFYGYNLIINEN